MEDDNCFGAKCAAAIGLGIAFGWFVLGPIALCIIERLLK